MISTRTNSIVAKLRECNLDILADEMLVIAAEFKFAVKNPWIEGGMIYLTINKKKYGYSVKKGVGGAKKVIEKFKEIRKKKGIGKALSWFKKVTILKVGGSKKKKQRMAAALERRE